MEDVAYAVVGVLATMLDPLTAVPGLVIGFLWRRRPGASIVIALFTALVLVAIALSHARELQETTDGARIARALTATVLWALIGLGISTASSRA